jgi:hypothetical protein
MASLQQIVKVHGVRTTATIDRVNLAKETCDRDW